MTTSSSNRAPEPRISPVQQPPPPTGREDIHPASPTAASPPRAHHACHRIASHRIASTSPPCRVSRRRRSRPAREHDTQRRRRYRLRFSPTERFTRTGIPCPAVDDILLQPLTLRGRSRPDFLQGGRPVAVHRRRAPRPTAAATAYPIFLRPPRGARAHTGSARPGWKSNGPYASRGGNRRMGSARRADRGSPVLITNRRVTIRQRDGGRESSATRTARTQFGRGRVLTRIAVLTCMSPFAAGLVVAGGSLPRTVHARRAVPRGEVRTVGFGQLRRHVAVGRVDDQAARLISQRLGRIGPVHRNRLTTTVSTHRSARHCQSSLPPAIDRVFVGGPGWPHSEIRGRRTLLAVATISGRRPGKHLLSTAAAPVPSRRCPHRVRGRTVSTRSMCSRNSRMYPRRNCAVDSSEIVPSSP